MSEKRESHSQERCRETNERQGGIQAKPANYKGHKWCYKESDHICQDNEKTYEHEETLLLARVGAANVFADP